LDHINDRLPCEINDGRSYARSIVFWHLLNGNDVIKIQSDFLAVV